MDGSHQIRPLEACALSVPPARRKSPPGCNKQNHLTIGPPRISAGLHAVISGASPLWLPGGHGNTSPYVYASPPSAANVRSCRVDGRSADVIKRGMSGVGLLVCGARLSRAGQRLAPMARRLPAAVARPGRAGCRRPPARQQRQTPGRSAVLISCQSNSRPNSHAQGGVPTCRQRSGPSRRRSRSSDETPISLDPWPS